MKLIYELKLFFIELVSNRRLIYELVKRDIQTSYMGSYLGFIWTFLQPLMFILVLNLVFTIGIRVGKLDDIPFIVFLVSGIVAWMYFSVSINTSANVIREYSFMVTKLDFNLSVLPVIKLFSSLIVHIFLLFLSIIIIIINGIGPSIYLFQIFYYLLSMMVLLLGIGWITSSISIFIKDMSNIVSIILQFGFWLTPIIWNIERVPEKYHWIIKLNPVFYIVNGYRDSMIYQIPFWDRQAETVYFWSFTVIVTILGILIFRKLRPHFAEVI